MYAGNDMCPLLFLPSSFSCSKERARLSSRAKRAERARSEGSALGPKSRSLASLGMTCSRAVSIKKGREETKGLGMQPGTSDGHGFRCRLDEIPGDTQWARRQ